MQTKPSRSLLESAKEFLAESLENLNDRKLRFAIVHAVTATELVLKERLSRVNPGLILEDIDAKNHGKSRTVSLRSLPQRFANLGMPLSRSDCQLIDEIAAWRNDIVHYAPSFEREDARRQLPRLLEFLANSLRADLDVPLETFLPKGLFKVAHGLLDDWKKAVAAAQANASVEGEVLEVACPRCGGVKVISTRGDNLAHCHLCATTLYRLDSCDACGERTVTSYGTHMGENVCDRCVAEGGDLYIQRLIDHARGK